MHARCALRPLSLRGGDLDDHQSLQSHGAQISVQNKVLLRVLVVHANTSVDLARGQLGDLSKLGRDLKQSMNGRSKVRTVR